MPRLAFNSLKLFTDDEWAENGHSKKTINKYLFKELKKIKHAGEQGTFNVNICTHL